MSKTTAINDETAIIQADQPEFTRMDETVAQALARIHDDIRELKHEIAKNAEKAEEAVKETRAAATDIRCDLTAHALQDAQTFTKIIATCESIQKEISDGEKRLWGIDNDGTTGVIAVLQKSLYHLEQKIAVAIGGGIVIVFILERFLHMFNILNP